LEYYSGFVDKGSSDSSKSRLILVENIGCEPIGDTAVVLEMEYYSGFVDEGSSDSSEAHLILGRILAASLSEFKVVLELVFWVC